MADNRMPVTPHSRAQATNTNESWRGTRTPEYQATPGCAPSAATYRPNTIRCRAKYVIAEQAIRTMTGVGRPSSPVRAMASNGAAYSSRVR